MIHPPALLKEIETLGGQGIDVGRRLHISDRAHVILPYHLDEERLDGRVGLAGRPSGDDAPGDRSVLQRQGRPGARRPGRRPLPCRRRFATGWRESSITRTGCWGRCSRISRRSTPTAVADEYLGYAERLRPFVRDTTSWLHEALDAGRRLLFEGAQGSLLDVDHGSYPYVTSSNSSAAGIAAGSGVPTRHIDRWIGVVKAYTTRVGGGPFPTEQDNAIGERIRRVGREYGTVTGRPRRCGWFDAVAVRYAARVSGSTELAVMLLDVLSGIDELKVAVAYEHDGRRTSELPELAGRLRALSAGLRDAPRLERRSDQDQTLVRSARSGRRIMSSFSGGRWACR